MRNSKKMGLATVFLSLLFGPSTFLTASEPDLTGASVPLSVPVDDGEQVRSGAGGRDFVINDDLIVQGSGCFGFDCVDGESFGFDSLRLKENNVRLTFIDTSTAAGFPAGSWQLRANDSPSGGQDHFSIDWLGTSATGGPNDNPVSTPFRVDGAAPSNALRIATSGDVGIGIASPAARLHVSGGDLRVDGAIYQLSSRALKTDFASLDPAKLLGRLASLDLGLWRYRDQPTGGSHFGPAAEDFFALFGLGHSGDSIAVADLAGVALGAAQALKQELDQKNAEIQSLEAEVDALNDRLLRLEQMMDARLAEQER